MHHEPKPVPIPASWRKSVTAILRKGASSDIVVKKRALDEFSARFPDSWAFQRNAAMADALSPPVVLGRPIKGMSDPGEVWAFWFYYSGVKMYGKINLTPSGKIIIIYSAHVPNKGEEHL